jgi:hypothetical protein
MEPWRAYTEMFADSHHFNEEQGLDPDPHLSEKLDAGPQPWASYTSYKVPVPLHFHLTHSILLCTVSKYRGFRVYSMNKTGGRRKWFMTSASAPSLAPILE